MIPRNIQVQNVQAKRKRVPVIYTDIDGTVRMGKDELGYFVNTADQVKVFPEVPDLLSAYKDLGWRIVGVSNQGGIALGHMDLETCVAAMQETDKQCNGQFDKITFCPHHPSAEDPVRAICWCRKPRPGMVIESAFQLTIEHPDEVYMPHMAIFVGDRPEDQQCAENAGLQFVEAAAWRKGIHLDLVVAETLK